MERIITPFTEKLGISSPIALAPMAFGSCAALAAAASAKPRLGTRKSINTESVTIPGLDDAEKIRENLRSVRKSLSIPDGEVIPVGVGFINWILDITEALDEPLIHVALAEKPKALWFAFGPNMGRHIQSVRDYDAKRSDGHKTLVFAIVSSVEMALKAANEWGVDVLVAQGIEAGGHGATYAPPLFSLLPAILAAFPPGQGPLVIGAGGVSTGAQVAALLTLGASGAAVGTRFLFTPESIYTDDMKAELVKADFGATARGMMFDEVMAVPGCNWPENHDGRALSNEIVTDSQKGLSLDERQRLFNEATTKGEVGRTVMWAGVGVGLTKEIKPAAEVVMELHTDTIKSLMATPKISS
ncbi:hypothetical protein PTI98_012145 [Pleurotus ostreatus]|nr:hypothetical protein PTI98_012145 [Pleurotus ostreatus]